MDLTKNQCCMEMPSLKNTQTIETYSEVQIQRDESDTTKRDEVTIILRSRNESIDSLIKKAFKATEKTENLNSNIIKQEWIK